MATSSRDIFDEIEIEQKPGQEIVSSEQESVNVPEQLPDSPPMRILKAAAAGGLGNYGDLLDLLHAQSKERLPGEKLQRQTEFDTLQKMNEPGYKPSFMDISSLSEDDELAPRFSRFPNKEETKEFFNVQEPTTGPERYEQQIGERVGQVLTFPGSIPALLSSVAGAGTGQTIRELGGPEWLANVVDIGTSFLGGGAKKGREAKKIVPNKEQEKLVKRLRHKGFSEKEITPLIQSEKKIRKLAKFTSKDEKLANRLFETKGKIGELYDQVREKGKKLPGLDRKGYANFNRNLKKSLEDIPPGYLRLLKEDLSDLANSQHKITDLVDFYQDIGRKVGGQKGGKAILNKLKKPIRDAIEDISPQVARDYNLANSLNTKLSKTALKLRPRQVEELIDAGDMYALASGLATGNAGLLTKVLGMHGGKMVGRELLINPRLQNIAKRIGQQIKKNSPKGMINSLQVFINELSKKGKSDIFDELEIED